MLNVVNEAGIVNPFTIGSIRTINVASPHNYDNINNNNNSNLNNVGNSISSISTFKKTEPAKSEFFIRFEVIDTGLGIEKERIGSIFNLFEHNQNVPLKESSKDKSCKLIIVI